MAVWESSRMGFDASVAVAAKTVWASARAAVERAIRRGASRSSMRTAKGADDRVSTSSVQCVSSSGRVVETQVAWFRFEGDLLLGDDHEETTRILGEVMAWHRAQSSVFWARLSAYEPARRVSLAALPGVLGECGSWLVEP